MRRIGEEDLKKHFEGVPPTSFISYEIFFDIKRFVDMAAAGAKPKKLIRVSRRNHIFSRLQYCGGICAVPASHVPSTAGERQEMLTIKINLLLLL